VHEPTVLSTFSGVGGLDLGLARAGWRHVLLCEAEPYRRAVLAERFPGVPISEDVREVATSGGGRPLAGVVGGVGDGADGGRGGPWAEDGDDPTSVGVAI
jgi:DNA (cytosine-5)-methyltransferase 1